MDKEMSLPPELQQQLSAVAHTIQVEAGESLFMQGDDALAGYLVVEGVVEVEQTLPNGRSFVLCRHEGGSLFCPLTVLSGEPQLGTAYARSAAKVQVVRREDMLQLLYANREFFQFFHQRCFQHLYHLVRRLQDAQIRGLRARLGEVLLERAEKETTAQGNSCWVVRATHQQIAQWLGTSREAVSRELAALKREGLITTARGKIVLTDRQGIRQLMKE